MGCLNRKDLGGWGIYGSKPPVSDLFIPPICGDDWGMVYGCLWHCFNHMITPVKKGEDQARRRFHW